MRTDYTWFERRAGNTWTACPGRSFLLVVPHGCDEIGAAQAASDWSLKHLCPPDHCRNHRPVVVRVSSDTTSSARQLVNRLRRELSEAASNPLDLDPEEFPSDILEAIVDAAHVEGLYPVIVIERFHAFARIGDTNFLSVLAALRKLEHALSVTTLAISPLTYEQIRRQLTVKGQYPFVNSAYGDNHDQAVMKPVSRDEFVSAAELRSLSTRMANRLYSLGGGPDAVFEVLLDVATNGEEDVVERCVARLGDRLDRFTEDLFGEPGYDATDVLGRLAIGELTPIECGAVLGHPLFAFFAREDRASGRILPASPILGRLFLRRTKGPESFYNECLDAVRIGDYTRAASLLRSIEPKTTRLKVFAEVVEIIAIVNGGGRHGLFGIDWRRVGQLCKTLAKAPDVPKPWHPWLARLLAWASLINDRTASSDDARERLDYFTPLAVDQEIYDLLLYAMSVYLKQVRRRSCPASDRVRDLLMLPEAVLQVLAARFCGIKFNEPPDCLPAGPNYDSFFEGRGTFQYSPDRKMDLTTLLVVVPAILSIQPKLCSSAQNNSDNLESVNVIEFLDPLKVRSLHQKLTARLRNPTAHTYAAVTLTEGAYFDTLCSKLLELMAVLTGQPSVDAFIKSLGEPSLADLYSFIFGFSFVTEASMEQ